MYYRLNATRKSRPNYARAHLSCHLEYIELFTQGVEEFTTRRGGALWGANSLVPPNLPHASK